MAEMIGADEAMKIAEDFIRKNVFKNSKQIEIDGLELGRREEKLDVFFVYGRAIMEEGFFKRKTELFSVMIDGMDKKILSFTLQRTRLGYVQEPE
ncbi:MAG: hypothetical protein KKI07_01320 [Euryarchaeota archaeon]|nr:hypothetical protein [Euryarchaeota archaeon]